MESEDKDMHLTINDYIDLPGGLRMPYCAINTQPEEINVQEEPLQIQGEVPYDVASLTVPTTCENESLDQSSSNQGSSPPLPPGKNYHVFFSHSSEDREWVLQVVNKLESPEYGFKCCFADRDFDLGAPVFMNITKCINLSKKTVIVLTPEFLQSPWCSYETRITIEMDLDTRQRLLVPVMLRNCRVPDFIGRLSYIEVENEHFWDRFLQALKDESSVSPFNEAVGSAAIIGANPFQFNPNFFSTDIISEVNVYIQNCCCNEPPTDFMPNELLRHGLSLTSDEYKEIVNSIKGMCYVRCHGFYSIKLYFMLVVFLMFAYFMISMGILIVTYDVRKALTVIPAWAFTAIIMWVLRLMVVMKTTKKLSKRTVEANKIAITRNMMVSVKDNSDPWYKARDRISIIFMYYEWRPCQSYLREHLHEMRSARAVAEQAAIEDDEHRPLILPQNESLSMSQEEFETYADNLLLHHATEYGRIVLKGRTKNPSEQRHTLQKECLCQFVESILLSGKTSCLDSVYGGPTRHPWRHLVYY